jgi:shikimate kinase
MSHVFLVGFMGAGKSTVARLASEKLGRPCIDLDEAIESAEGRSVREIFEDLGESRFRELESAQLESLAQAEPSVVACGGGVVLRDENRSALKRMGTVVYLRVSAGETLARLGVDGTRPLLNGPGGVIAATSLLEARESLYAAVADITIDTVGRTAEQVARDVVAVVEEGAA